MKPTIKFDEGSNTATLSCSQEDMLYIMSLMCHTLGNRFSGCLQDHDDLVEEYCYDLYTQVVDSVEVTGNGSAITPHVAFKEVLKLRVRDN